MGDDTSGPPGPAYSARPPHGGVMFRKTDCITGVTSAGQGPGIKGENLKNAKIHQKEN